MDTDYFYALHNTVLDKNETATEKGNMKLHFKTTGHVKSFIIQFLHGH
jgi:hypothetical protein